MQAVCCYATCLRAADKLYAVCYYDIFLCAAYKLHIVCCYAISLRAQPLAYCKLLRAQHHVLSPRPCAGCYLT